MPTTDHDSGPDQPERDLIDALPRLGRATTPLERAFGPSCLLSLVILLLLLLVLKRFLVVSWLGLGVLGFLIWYAVLALLIRWRPDHVPDEED